MKSRSPTDLPPQTLIHKLANTETFFSEKHLYPPPPYDIN